MKNKISSAMRDELLSAKTFTAFLQTLASERGAMAAISRRAGFKSRGYFSELISGKKNLSQDSLRRLKMALRLSKSWLGFFECLVWEGSTQLRPQEITLERIPELKAKFRKEILTQDSNDAKKDSMVVRCIQTPYLFQVYAALGSPAVGATIENVTVRTGLNARQVNRYLKKLSTLGAVVEADGRYYAPVTHAENLKLDNGTEGLAEMVKHVSLDINRNRERILKDKNNLTIYSAFSVRKEELPLLKLRLRTAVNEILDEFQNDEGNHVQQVFLSLHGNPFVNEATD